MMPDMRRRRALAAMAGTPLLLLVAACDSSRNGAPNAKDGKTPFNLGIVSSVGQSTAIIADKKGFFEKNGLRARVFYFGSGADVITGYLSGGLDAIDVGTLSAYLLWSRKQLPEPILVYNSAQIQGVVVRTAANIKSHKDLVGKKVAVPLGSIDVLSLQLTLKEHGVDPASVQLVNMQNPDMLSALSQGVVDAAATFEPTLSRIVKELGAQVQVLTRYDGKDEDARSCPSCRLFPARVMTFVSPQWADEHPEAVKSIVLSFWQAGKWIHDNPADAARTIAETLKFKESEVAEGLKYIGWNNPLLTPQIIDQMKLEIEYLNGKGEGPGSLDINPLFERGMRIQDQLKQQYGNLLPPSG